MKPQGRSKRRAIIVLGAERSGTSVVAEMVRRWGAYAGDAEKLMKGDEQQSARGYMEHPPIWDFLAKLGDFAEGVSYWDASFEERIKSKLPTLQYRDEALGLVAGMQRDENPWVWKDPGLNFFLPFWKEIWGEATYLIMVRNPLDTALSWKKFVMARYLADSSSLIEVNLLRWQYQTLRILRHTDTEESKMFLCFEDLMREPRTQAGKLHDFLDRNCQTNLSDDMGMEGMAQAVNPLLWHDRSQTSFSQVREASKEQKALYRFLQGMVRDPLMKFDVANYAMPSDWIDVVKNEEARRKPLVPDESG